MQLMLQRQHSQQLHRQLSRQSRQQLRKQLHRQWLLKLQLLHY
jgi:hypothetical protein